MTKKQNKIKHDYLCDNCGKPATWNYQNAYHLYFIDKNGKMKEENNYEGDVNEFYCDKCAAEEDII